MSELPEKDSVSVVSHKVGDCGLVLELPFKSLSKGFSSDFKQF